MANDAVKKPDPLSDNSKIALTYEECAEAIGISVRHLRTLVKRFRFPHVQMGRSIRFLPDDARAWLEKQRKRAI